MILTLSCPDRRGIVARVSAFLFERGCNILDAQQFDDQETGRFFMRVVFDASSAEATPCAPPSRPWPQPVDELADCAIRAERQKRDDPGLKFDHCLADLLYRWRIGELPMDIAGIVVQPPGRRLRPCRSTGLPFHHLPVTTETKLEQEAALWSLIQDTKTELVVLARYMQVLSDGLSAKLEGRCINIHHSFLPGFKGAKPYHQAHARGVKVIGASAHYVTADLDEGPIIEQDVERISHRDTPEDLIRKGRDIERRVLARAVALPLLEDRGPGAAERAARHSWCRAVQAGALGGRWSPGRRGRRRGWPRRSRGLAWPCRRRREPGRRRGRRGRGGGSCASWFGVRAA
jgi:formyltetrahydrofolate deformylase